MPKFRATLIFALVIGVAIATALLFAEHRWQRAEANQLAAHQVRYECLVAKSQKLPSCAALAGRFPDDFDSCGPAVAACQASGKYAASRLADEAAASSWKHVRELRIAACIAAVTILGMLAWPARQRASSGASEPLNKEV